MILLILLVLAILVLAGGFGYNEGAYRSHGIGAVGLILLVLLVLFLAGKL